MAKNRIITYFFIVTALSIGGLFFLFFNNYTFNISEISQDTKMKIAQKEQDIINKIRTNYKVNFKAPIVISDKLPNKNFGMATYNSKNKQIIIYLNKKRFQESENYMIKDVLPHEYAHALMFAFGHFSNKNSGHSKDWQKACLSIGGIKCDRFVNHQDIVIDKIF